MARPSRVDRGHECIRQIAYRERGEAVRALRDAAEAVLVEWGRGGEDWYRPCFDDCIAALGEALARWAHVAPAGAVDE